MLPISVKPGQVIADFQKYEGILRKLISEKFSEREREALAKYGVTIQLTTEKDNSFIYSDRIVQLTVVERDASQIPLYMRRFMTDFATDAIHELTHPLLELSGATDKADTNNLGSLAFSGAINKVKQKAISIAGSQLARVESALKQDNFLIVRFFMEEITLNKLKELAVWPRLAIDFDSLSDQQKIAILIGTFTSSTYMTIMGYTNLNNLYRKEDCCNIRSLIATFPDQAIQAVARPVLQYLDERIAGIDLNRIPPLGKGPG